MVHGTTCPLVCADALRAHYQTHHGLTVLDTDFAAGQTVLSVWSALRDVASAAQPVHVIAITPRLAAADLIRQHTHSPFADSLIAALPPDINGTYRLLLDGGRIVLTLIIGDVITALSSLLARIDVFYLKRVSLSVLTVHSGKRLGQLAHVRAHLVCEGDVDGLLAIVQAGGFVMDRTTVPLTARYQPRWAVRARDVVPASERRAIVIGAGLAGAAIAERLTVRGWDVTVFEAASAPATAASGNLAGVYMPMVSQDDNPASRMHRAGYVFAQQLWSQLGGVGQGMTGEACGVLQVARDDAQQDAFMQAARKWQYPASFAQCLDRQAAGKLLGMATRGGWFFPRAGWLRPSSVCAALFAASGQHAGTVTVRCATKVARLVREDGQWTAFGEAGGVLACAPVAILANGMDALHFDVAGEIPLTAIRGQVSHVPEDALPALPVVLCGDGYMTRAYEGLVSVGATYGPPDGRGVNEQDHLDNLDKLAQLLPELDPLPAVKRLSGRVGVRCVTPDRMPLIGALPAATSHDVHGIADKGLGAVPKIPGLFALLGYASRGLITAPLAAEMLACQLSGEPMPVASELKDAVDPARFMLRRIRKSGQSQSA